MPSTTPASPVKKGWGCVLAVAAALGVVLLGGWAITWGFRDRTTRANNFGNYIREGFTVRQVFAGPREWDFLWVSCTVEGVPRSVHVRRQEGQYVALGEAVVPYPNLEALVADVTTGAGPFKGREAIHLVYKYYVVSRTYVLKLGADGKVVKIEKISRG